MSRRSDRLDCLLTRRAIEGLDSGAARELVALLGEYPDVDPEALDRAAAAIHVVAIGSAEPMPAALRRRIERDAARYVGRRPAEDRRPTR